MSVSLEMPKLELAKVNGKDRYIFENRSGSFLPHLWLPTLLEVHHSQTIGELKSTLGNAIVRTAASYHGDGLMPMSKSRGQYIMPPKSEARFKIKEGESDLKFLRLDRATIAFQTPDIKTPHPAFSEIKQPEIGYHRIVKHPEEELSSVERNLGHQVLSMLAYEMDGWHLDHKLTQKLEDVGVAI
ncbi:MAG TPA: hypothetical protein VLF39_03290 [Candidatus Saccharimonadales bacterium]|nr:hypothetical protein [Candidatus Saccharimonadales bacterium]